MSSFFSRHLLFCHQDPLWLCSCLLPGRTALRVFGNGTSSLFPVRTAPLELLNRAGSSLEAHPIVCQLSLR